jgi:predicted PurR-regulated permease PerM
MSCAEETDRNPVVESSTPRPSATRTGLPRSANLAMVVAATCIIVASLRAASSVLAPVVGALFVALIVAAPIPWLSRFVPRWAACVIVGAVALGALAVVGVATPIWVSKLQAVIAEHRESLRELPTLLAKIGGPELGEGLGSSLTPNVVFDVSRSIVRIVTGTLAAIVFTAFILAELAGVRAKLSAAFEGDPLRGRVFNRIADRLSEYFRVKTVASAATGVVAAATCALLGVPLPGLWGLVAFVLNYAPTVGSLVAAVPPVVLATVTMGWERGAFVAVAYLAINGIIGGVIEPKVLGERLGLSPLVVLLSLVFWGWVWGAIGLLLAVPMTMVVKLIFEQIEGFQIVGTLLGSAREARRRRGWGLSGAETRRTDA